MVANKIKKKYLAKIWILFFTILISIFFSSYSYANTYRWEDITEPFSSEFELIEGQIVTIEIRIPELVIKNLEKIPLLINHSAIHSASNYPSVQINNSIWATYNFSNSKFLNIKIKHLQAGANKLNFFLKSDNSDRGDPVGVTIKEIRFDFADLGSLREQLAEEKNLKIRAEVSADNKTKEDSDIKKSEKHRQKNLKKIKDSKHPYDKRTRKYLQHALTFLGYYHGTVDGVFGHKTRKAIKAYQKKHGEMPTGHFNKKTAKELVQIGKKASKNAGKKSTTKSKARKKILNPQNKITDDHGQKKMDSLFLSIRKKIEENQKEKAREIERSVKLIQANKNKDSKKADAAAKKNDGIVRTPEELGARYQSLIDRFNISMNDAFYNQMISSIQSCDRKGYYVSGAFISHYLYLRFKDLSSKAPTKLEAHRNSRLSEGFKITRNQLIMQYNISEENKQALGDVLNKCEIYYQTTKERLLHRRN